MTDTEEDREWSGMVPGAPLWPGASRPVEGWRVSWLPLMIPAAPIGAIVMLCLFFFTYWWAALVLGVLAMLLIAGLLWSRADSLCARALAGPGLEECDSERILNMVEGLCASLGLDPPSVWQRDDAAPNIASFGSRADSFHLVVTRGLDEAMTTLELEAVLSHELAHFRAGHAPSLTAVAAASGLYLPRAYAAAVARRKNALEQQADAWALSVTRYPPALISALVKLQEADLVTSASRGRTASWLWAKSDRVAGEASEERLSLLAEL